MHKIYAAANDIIGQIVPPPTGYGNYYDSNGIVSFFTNVLRLVFLVAGLYALINFIIAGYQYMTAAGDTKSLDAAWARIWQTLVGLLIIVGAFVLTSIISLLFFGNATQILNPIIYGPGDAQ